MLVHTRDMRTPTREHARAERLREHAAAVEHARRVVAAMGLVVRAREARAHDTDDPLEVRFASADVEARALPAAVWVALRHGDIDAAIDAMTDASQTPFLIEEREVVGDGYRLQCIQDTLPLPESDLLMVQLGRALDLPVDVLTVVAGWGADDPRASAEVDDLLSRRFGPVDRDDESAATSAPTPAGGSTQAQPPAHLTMTVADAAQVLRLDHERRRALEILVSKATVSLTR